MVFAVGATQLVVAAIGVHQLIELGFRDAKGFHGRPECFGAPLVLAVQPHAIDNAVQQMRIAAHGLGKAEHLALTVAFVGGWHLDHQLAICEHARHGQLHGIAEIDRDRNIAAPRVECVAERQQVGDARDDGGDRMDVHSGNELTSPFGMELRIDSFLSCRLQIAADRVEQEGSRAATGVENTLLQRFIDRRADHFGCKPIGRVVFAQAMALVAVDQRLVEKLQNIDLDVVEAEAGDMAREPHH